MEVQAQLSWALAVGCQGVGQDCFSCEGSTRLDPLPHLSFWADSFLSWGFPQYHTCFTSASKKDSPSKTGIRIVSPLLHFIG